MRADGKKLKNIDPMYTVAAFIMSKRSDSMNMIELNLPLEPMQKYINAKRKENVSISHLGLILAAYTRTIAEFPALNRFVVNKRIYARNELPVGMVVLQEGIKGHGTMSKIYFDQADDIFTVQNKIDTYINENRDTSQSNKTDKIIQSLLSVPGILPVGVGLFKFMDRYGLLPKSIIEASPFHISMVITNLASIRTNHIYHHVYDFGTTSISMALGVPKEVPKRVGGEIIHEKCLPIGMVMDERIASGSYFALAFRSFSHYLKHPELLELPPEKIEREVEPKPSLAEKKQMKLAKKAAKKAKKSA